MTIFPHLVVKPLDVKTVPSNMEWCVYDEERRRGTVQLPKTVYMIVLALRWILTYEERGLEEEYRTWRVYWSLEDECGFETRIYLVRDKVVQYDNWASKDRELQPKTHVELARLKCNNGKGNINHVIMQGAQPYGERVEMSGLMGVRRLLEDAILGSKATHNFFPFSERDGYVTTWRIGSDQEADGDILGFKLEKNAGKVVSKVDLKVWPHCYDIEPW